MPTLVLQINSKEALDRLIGGNAEVEVQIRNSVVQEFAKQHLKAVANTVAIQQLEKTTKLIVEQTLENHFGLFEKGARTYVFNDTFAKEIEKVVQGQVNEQIRKTTYKIIEEALLKQIDSKTLDDRIEYVIAQYLQVEVRKIMLQHLNTIVEGIQKQLK